MSRNLIFYTLLIAIFGSLLWFVFNQGAKLEVLQTGAAETQEVTSAPNPKVGASAPAGAIVVFLSSLFQNLEHPLSLLLIQIVVIVISSKLLASLVSKIGQ